MKLLVVVEVWELKSNFISHFTEYAITNPCWDYSWIVLEKRNPSRNFWKEISWQNGIIHETKVSEKSACVVAINLPSELFEKRRSISFYPHNIFQEIWVKFILCCSLLCCVLVNCSNLSRLHILHGTYSASTTGQMFSVWSMRWCVCYSVPVDTLLFFMRLLISCLWSLCNNWVSTKIVC